MLVEAVGNIQKLEMKQDASAVRLREDWQGWVLQPGTLAFVSLHAMHLGDMLCLCVSLRVCVNLSLCVPNKGTREKRRASQMCLGLAQMGMSFWSLGRGRCLKFRIRKGTLLKSRYS